MAELEAKRQKRSADKLPPVSPVETAAPKAPPAAPNTSRKKVLITEPGNA